MYPTTFTSCDLCSYKVEIAIFNRVKGDTFTRNIRTEVQTHNIMDRILQ